MCEIEHFSNLQILELFFRKFIMSASQYEEFHLIECLIIDLIMIAVKYLLCLEKKILEIRRKKLTTMQ